MSATLKAHEDLKQRVMSAAAAVEPRDHHRQAQPLALGHARHWIEQWRRSILPDARDHAVDLCWELLRDVSLRRERRRHARGGSIHALASLLQRQPAAQLGRYALRPRPERRERASPGVVDDGASRPACAYGAVHALLAHPAPVCGHLAAYMARRGGNAERLDMPGGLPQAPVLLQVAAHELDRAL